MGRKIKISQCYSRVTVLSSSKDYVHKVSNSLIEEMSIWNAWYNWTSELLTAYMFILSNSISSFHEARLIIKKHQQYSWWIVHIKIQLSFFLAQLHILLIGRQWYPMYCHLILLCKTHGQLPDTLEILPNPSCNCLQPCSEIHPWCSDKWPQWWGWKYGIPY